MKTYRLKREVFSLKVLKFKTAFSRQGEKISDYRFCKFVHLSKLIIVSIITFVVNTNL